MKSKNVLSLTIYFIIYIFFLFIVNSFLLINNEYTVFIDSESEFASSSEKTILKKYKDNEIFNDELLAIETKISDKTKELSLMDVGSDQYDVLDNTIKQLENTKYRSALFEVHKVESKKNMTLRLVIIDIIGAFIVLFFVLANEFKKNKLSDIMVIAFLTFIIIYNTIMHGVVNSNSLEFILSFLIIPTFMVLYGYYYSVLYKRVNLITDEKKDK